MPDDKKMLCLIFDDNNLEFSYLLGLSILLPTIVLVYCLLKFLLQLLIHHPQNMSHPKKREIEIVTNEKSDASDQAEDQLDEAKGQQAVLYRFRQRQKKIQIEITSCSKLIAKEEESYVSKAPPRLRDGDLVHFSHRHPLLRFHVKGTEVIRCNMCTIIISGVAYGCDRCRTFSMRYALTFLKEFDMIFILCTHSPFFPFLQSFFGIRKWKASSVVWHVVMTTHCFHLLSLFSFYYHCDLCKFVLHLECASVTTKLIHKVKYPLDLFTSFPLKREGAALLCCICNQVMNRQSAWLFYNREFDYICHFECAAEEELGKSLLLRKSFPDQQQKLEKLGEVIHFSHRHPLKAIKQMNEASIMNCCICSNQALSGYICQLCNYYIDETCFPLPRRIQHNFHPNHPLILASYNNPPKSKCRACGDEDGAKYRCSTCKFSLHRSCAGAPMTFTPGTNKKVSYKLLYLYPYDGEMAVIKCSGCSRELNSKEGFMYYNFDLDEVLHVRCALHRETDSYDTKFVFASERLKSIKIEEDHS
ncbi:hypothetical protein H5410_040198 [Solanum commersonii]|uniref:Phorbol-ester/DAG-type domain-containing protein n=1 Tax=Solanum commersonii TaxID=4109 RepID=A0A9J5XQN6_SOLCO|nr:hypothetical protein H5410_040198 [Solanum commersonii]